MKINKKQQLKHIANCVMVDTLGLRVENVPNADLPKMFSPIIGDAEIDVNGSWSKGSVESDFGKQSIRVRGVKKTSALLVEGSNAVHYQGHNIVSSNDVTMSAYSMLYAVKEKYSFGFEDLRRPWCFLRGEDIEITRIDTPILISIPNGLQKSQIINALALAGILDGINTSLYVDQTVYYEQHSQSAALKLYDKAAEMQNQRRKNSLPDSPYADALLELADQTIRLEAVYRQKYFKHHANFRDRLVSPAMLTPQTLATMFLGLFMKYNLRGNLRRNLRRDDLWAIRQPYRNTVAHWQNGMDLLKMFDNNQAKLNAHHRVIKDEYSINIFALPPGEIDVPIELGEILQVENFVPVPPTIRSDASLFYQRDLHAENREICKELGVTSFGKAYIHPNQQDDEESLL